MLENVARFQELYITISVLGIEGFRGPWMPVGSCFPPCLCSLSLVICPSWV